MLVPKHGKLGGGLGRLQRWLSGSRVFSVAPSPAGMSNRMANHQERRQRGRGLELGGSSGGCHVREDGKFGCRLLGCLQRLRHHHRRRIGHHARHRNLPRHHVLTVPNANVSKTWRLGTIARAYLKMENLPDEAGASLGVSSGADCVRINSDGGTFSLHTTNKPHTNYVSYRESGLRVPPPGPDRGTYLNGTNVFATLGVSWGAAACRLAATLSLTSCRARCEAY